MAAVVADVLAGETLRAVEAGLVAMRRSRAAAATAMATGVAGEAAAEAAAMAAGQVATSVRAVGVSDAR